MRQRNIKSEGKCQFCGASRLLFAGRVDGYGFLECPDCGFVFSPDVEPAAVEQRYLDVESLVGEGLPGTGWADDTFLDPAIALLPNRPLTILDFGTGESVVPDMLRGKGHRVIAVDLAAPLRPHPDRLTGRLEDLPLRPDSFDLAFSYQVFEHLTEPRPVLDALFNVTRDGGLVAIHTDMETDERPQDLQNEDLADWFYACPPDHCAFYRHRTFETALRGTPHSIVYMNSKMVVFAVKSPTSSGG